MECYFCQHNIRDIDFKERQILRRFISASGKIKSKKRTGTCSGHQRKLTKAIKKARYLALISPIAK